MAEESVAEKEIKFPISRADCYLALLRVVLGTPRYDLEFLMGEKIFSSQKRINQLMNSFNQILEKRGRDRFSEEEARAITRWFGLEDGDAYYGRYGVTGGCKKIAEELGLKPEKGSKLVLRGVKKLRRPENIQLLPPEVKDFLPKEDGVPASPCRISLEELEELLLDFW